MFKRLKSAFLIVTMVIMSAVLSAPAGADGISAGLTLSKDGGAPVVEISAERGDYFTLDITIPEPENGEYADTVTFTGKFNPKYLELVSPTTWTTGFDGFVSTSGGSGYSYTQAINGSNSDGFLRFAASTNDNTSGLPLPATLSAQFRVKPTARTRVAYIDLDTFTISNSGNTGRDYTELWDKDATGTNTRVTINLENLPPDVAPATTGGLSVNKEFIDENENLVATVTIPAIAWDADPAWIKLTYDTDKFELVSWDPERIGTKKQEVDSSNQTGTLTVEFPGGAKELDEPVTITATLKPKGVQGESDIVLTQEFKGVDSDGYLQPLWAPVNTEAQVYTTGLPVTGGGLTSSAASVYPEVKFDLTLEIPAITVNKAETGTLHISYDADVFTLTPEKPTTSGVTTSASGGSWDISFNNADLSNGLTLKAAVTPKKNATAKQYRFDLTGYDSVTGTMSNNMTHSLWQPATDKTKATVTVTALPVVPTVTGGGLVLSNTTPVNGETVVLSVVIPPVDVTATNADISVSFNGSAFTVTEPSPYASVDGLTVTPGNGTLRIRTSGTGADLSNGATVYTHLKVSDSAAPGEYTFKLDTSTLTAADVYNTPKQIWTPDTAQRTVKAVIEDDPYRMPRNGGGISATKSSVTPDDTFSVLLEIPKIIKPVDYANVVVKYNNDAFELVSWAPYITSKYSSDNESFRIESYGEPTIDLTDGATLEAKFKVRSNAAAGGYTFRLETSELKSSGETVWNPNSNMTSANVVVSDPKKQSSSSSQTQTPPTNPDQSSSTTARNYPAWWDDPRYFPFYYNPASPGNNSDSWSVPSNGSDAPTTAQNVDYVERTVTNSPGGEIPIVNDPDDMYYTELPDYAYDTTRPDSDAPLVIYLDSELNGIDARDVTVSTKRNYFFGDTYVILRNTTYAENCAVAALKALGLSAREYYSFDLSLLDTSTGLYLKYLPDNGYVEITMPVPPALENSDGNIGVFHVENGVPEAVFSSVSVENGGRKVKFMASEFSPYMLVGSANRSAAVTAAPVNNGGNGGNNGYNGNSGSNGNSGNNSGGNSYNGGSGTNGGTSRPANPNTGAAALIAIPAAVTGCVLLARRSKKRKRSSRR